MKLRNTSALVAAIAMAATIQATQASLTTDNLADLAAGNNTLAIGDKIFSGFSYEANLLTSFDSKNIQVTASIGSDGVYYLTWGGNISLASKGTTIADLKLNYIVQASDGPIYMIDQAYTGDNGKTLTNPGGLLSVDETVATGAFGGTIVGSSHLDALDLSDPAAEADDNLNITPPETLLYVTKDISLTTFDTANGTTVSISQVSQSFHEVPEPTTMIAGALLLLPFGASTLRILRKNRAV
jgi:hypothetical protein